MVRSRFTMTRFGRRKGARSVSPSNWNRQTRYSTNISTFYPSPSRSRGSYLTSDGRAPRRMKRSSRRRNANGKRSAVARKKSVERRRSANGSGGRRRSSSVRCAKKWSGFNARRGIGLLLGAVAGCGVYAVRVRLCARVPQREGAREQAPSRPLLGVIRKHQVGRQVPRKFLDRRWLFPRHEARLVSLGASRSDLDRKAGCAIPLTFVSIRYFCNLLSGAHVSMTGSSLDLFWTSGNRRKPLRQNVLP